MPEQFGGFCESVRKNVEAWENYVLNEEEFYLENMPTGYS